MLSTFSKTTGVSSWFLTCVPSKILSALLLGSSTDSFTTSGFLIFLP